MKKLLPILAFLLFAIAASATPDEQKARFQQANKAYENGDYEQAAELYDAIVADGYDSWELRYNLGNTHYRLDNIGPSILNYERALRMAPGKKVVKDNLALARSHTTDNIEQLPGLFLKEWATAVANAMPLRGWLTLTLTLALLCFASVSIFLIAKEYRIRKTIFIVGIALLAITLLSTLNAAISVHNATKDNEAIIMSPLVVVKGSPDAKSVDKFVLHEGTKVTIGDIQDNWWQIEIADGKNGWIDGGAERI